MNGVNGVTVTKVRARLSPEVNAKYKDYQSRGSFLEKKQGW